jgi:hypothetical protein
VLSVNVDSIERAVGEGLQGVHGIAMVDVQLVPQGRLLRHLAEPRMISWSIRCSSRGVAI